MNWTLAYAVMGIITLVALTSAVIIIATSVHPRDRPRNFGIRVATAMLITLAAAAAWPIGLPLYLWHALGD